MLSNNIVVLFRQSGAVLVLKQFFTVPEVLKFPEFINNYPCAFVITVFDIGNGYYFCKL